jgi:hypothetical protein
VRRWVSCEAPIPWPLLDEILPCLFQAKAEQLTQVCAELVEWAVADPNVAPRTPKRKHEKAASPNSKTNFTYGGLRCFGDSKDETACPP